ncbi:MAG: D-sedoheptulose-7-phosphate isomerase [Saprospiraceae bacterium]
MNISDRIEESIAVKKKILNDTEILSRIQRVGQVMASAFEQDHKVLFCGNGGSAADAQHIAAELSGRFYKDRRPLFAEALHVNSSYLTAVGNDYGFEFIYSRMVEAAGRPGDVLVAISTSGNSPNIIKAIETARKQGMVIIGMTGQTGGKMHELCDFLINVPSDNTPRIQESHILIGHIWCEIIEEILF